MAKIDVNALTIGELAWAQRKANYTVAAMSEESDANATETHEGTPTSPESFELQIALAYVWAKRSNAALTYEDFEQNTTLTELGQLFSDDQDAEGNA